jgi:hypothetical protein
METKIRKGLWLKKDMNTFFFKDTTPEAVPSNNKTGQYSLGLARTIVDEAKKRGIAPERALAMSAVESNFGKAHPSNPMRVSFGRIEPEIRDRYEPERQMAEQGWLTSAGTINDSTMPNDIKQSAMKARDMALTEGYQKANVKTALDYAIAQAKRFNDPMLKLQSYNGVGKVKDMYGISGITDLRKNPLWAKKVLAYEKSIKGQMGNFGLGGQYAIPTQK